MNDLERDLRSALDREASVAPPPHDAPGAVKRARRRQVGFVGATALGAVALVAIAVVGLRALGDGSETVTPASTTETMNGITITFPEAWALIDPDAAGLNGPPTETTPDVPRLVLALAPFDPGDLLACPGMSGDSPHTFLMTVQEQPLALSGDAARPWPVDLKPFGANASESGCYPGWEFLRAGWTAESRTFEARIGFAPDLSDDDRDALLAAFASMTFAPVNEGPTSVVLATGIAGGEEWSLTATNDGDELVLGLQGESFGTGVGGFDPRSDELQPSSHVFGSGAEAERVIFGAVPSDAVQVGLRVIEDDEALVDVLDVPDTIDSRLNAFVISVFARYDASIYAYDTGGRVVAVGAVRSGEGEPVDTPPPAENAELEDGRHFGFVRAVDVASRTIEFDLAYWLSGDEANEAYQEATGETGPVPNDYFVVNDNPRLRELSLAPDARVRLLDWSQCCDTFFDADLAVWAQAITADQHIEEGGREYSNNSGQVWITVEDGVVTRVEEQYTP